MKSAPEKIERAATLDELRSGLRATCDNAMLPPPLKGEVKKIVEEETPASVEQQETNDRTTEIAAALNRFENYHKTQNYKSERKDKAKALIDIAMILLLFGYRFVHRIGLVRFQGAVA
jgi:beta-glucosidase-like glycosyl hydrolase